MSRRNLPRATLLENIRAGRRDNARLGLQLSSIMALMGWSPSWSVTFSHLSDKFVELLLPAFSGAKRSEQKGHERTRKLRSPRPHKSYGVLSKQKSIIKIMGQQPGQCQSVTAAGAVQTERGSEKGIQGDWTGGRVGRAPD